MKVPEWTALIFNRSNDRVLRLEDNGYRLGDPKNSNRRSQISISPIRDLQFDIGTASLCYPKAPLHQHCVAGFFSGHEYPRLEAEDF
jgi:hypothetical protein